MCWKETMGRTWADLNLEDNKTKNSEVSLSSAQEK